MSKQLPSKFLPFYQAKKRVSSRIKSAQFEGVSAQTRDGVINNKNEIWDLQFTGLDLLDGDELEAFFRRRAVDGILWTAPNRLANELWSVKECDRETISGANQSNFTVSFERLYLE